MEKDIIIIGGGPAGAAAGVYAARKKLKTLVIAEEFGGQSVVSETIYNWIGTPEISADAVHQNRKKQSHQTATKAVQAPKRFPASVRKTKAGSPSPRQTTPSCPKPTQAVVAYLPHP